MDLDALQAPRRRLPPGAPARRLRHAVDRLAAVLDEAETALLHRA